MAVDPIIRDHQTWIGYLQPDGLVVSPTALADAQVATNRNAAPLQQRFLERVTEAGDRDKPVPIVRSTLGILREFLEWPDDCIVGATAERPMPEALKIPLKEFGETLEPTYAFVPPRPTDPERPWMLLVQELPLGTDLDAQRDSELSGWTASHTRRFERLLREAEVAIGLLATPTHFRLIYAPRGENTGTVTFPVAAMVETAGRPIVAAFEMLLCRERLLSAPTEARLPALLKRSRDYQARVSNTLAQQVLDALYELLRGFQAADDRAHGELLKSVLKDHPDSIYQGLLTVLMRLVFLLYAEDRGLMPTSDLYVRNYSIHGLFERLRTDAEQNPDTMDHRYGAWAQIIALCRAVYFGCEHPLFKMPAREGHLFDPDRYPFLEGQTLPDKRLPLVPDGTIERVLRKLLLLDGQRLSYRTLDVEQIGSVYETMMGFRLERAGGATIALKPAKAHGAPVPVNLEELLKTKSADRGKAIQDQTDYKLTSTMASGVKEAASVDDLLAALEKRIARNATPQPVSAGTMVLTPTDERRKTGSHYTPRSLTEPIVRKALEPILKQLGEHPEPDQILELKVCDPAMGSGAFLVEACRQLADQLVAAWAYHGYKPRIPADEDELLYARRLIAQRCLYGVDKNPMATDLAKLSLWLATLAKDHPFTFLDHSLRTGDSLVGLTRKQIAHFNLEGTGEPTFVQGKLNEQMENALRARRQILAAGDDMPPANKAQKLAVADEALEPARLAGDLCVAAFFDGSKPKERKEKRDEYLGLLAAWKQRTDAEAFTTIQAILKRLRGGHYPVTPFHWEIEFPEAFGGVQVGFSAVVGNPPFAGHVTLTESHRPGYTEYLRAMHPESSGKCDLVAFFFRRGFSFLKDGGTLGFIATNTIAQGDTRSSGLRWLCLNGANIFAARKRLKWPGQAAVIVSVVHLVKGDSQVDRSLDGRAVPFISAYLFTKGRHDDPERLIASTGRTFQGVVIRGKGFLFDDDTAEASPHSEMRRIIDTNPRATEVIRPYIGGEELNNSPTQDPHRYVIDFGGCEEDDLDSWPELRDIVEGKVRDFRTSSTARTSSGRVLDRWWDFGHRATDMYAAIGVYEHVLACSQVGPSLAFALQPTDRVLACTLVVTDLHTFAAFAAVQCRIHEVWARFFSSSMKDDMRYTPTDCFQTFPFPPQFETNHAMEVTGRAYYGFRAPLMVRTNEGLTKTYNRFHDPAEGDADVQKMRDLHDAMDRAVLDAYGWTDIQPACGFGLDYLDIEDEDMPPDLDVPEQLWWPTAAEALAFAAKLPPSRKRLPWRYRWPEESRDEVLARLLELNKQRAEEERRSGLAAEAGEKKPKTTKRRKQVVAAAELFETEAFTPVPVLEAVELMVAILDELAPARVQQVAAERMFILAVNARARDAYGNGSTQSAKGTSGPLGTFGPVWQSVSAMGYVTVSDAGVVTRRDQALTLTKPEHADMAKSAVALFQEGERLKRAWPVEVDNVQYIVP